MNDRTVHHPYRQPQEQPKPPGDPMRVIVWIAGGVAALIALFAIGLGVAERFTPKDPLPLYRAPPPPDPTPTPTRETVIHHEFDAGPRVLADGPLTYMVGSHWGDVQTTTWIIEDGRATLSMSAQPGKNFCSPVEKKISASDLAALGTHARSIHIENMGSNYMRGSGHFASTMVESGGVQFRIMHPERDADDARADVVALWSLHKHVERVTGTEQWVKTCKRTETKPNRR